MYLDTGSTGSLISPGRRVGRKTTIVRGKHRRRRMPTNLKGIFFIVIKKLESDWNFVIPNNQVIQCGEKNYCNFFS